MTRKGCVHRENTQSPERGEERSCSSEQGEHGKSCFERAFKQGWKEVRERALWVSGERCPLQREQPVQGPGHTGDTEGWCGWTAAGRGERRWDER